MGKVPSRGPKPEQRAAESEARTAALIRQHLADDDRPPRPQAHGDAGLGSVPAAA